MAKKRKTDTSWQVKARYNAKAYKGVSMQLKPEVFEGLEKACKEEELSRPELIKTLLEEKQRRKELKELKQELELKAKSTEGLWAYALNKRLADVFPHLPEEEKWQPIKVYWREDSVHVYGIWNNGLPYLDIFDHAALANFEEVEGNIRFSTIDKPAKYISRQDDSPMSEEEYKDWFFKTSEMSKEEYEEIVVKKGYENLPRIEILRMA